MQMVIDIPENIYDAIMDDETISREQLAVLEKHIYYGTPLPKGHGSLIDADELFDKIQFADFSSSDDVNTALFSIGNAPTIIEADTEGSESE